MTREEPTPPIRARKGRQAFSQAEIERRATTIPVIPYEPDERYRIYARVDGELLLLATCPNPASVGVALVQLHEDCRAQGRRLSDLGRIGVLDGHAHEWLVLPWDRGG